MAKRKVYVRVIKHLVDKYTYYPGVMPARVLEDGEYLVKTPDGVKVYWGWNVHVLTPLELLADQA